ncbi:MAG: hypothetical protein K2H02_00820, partial [Anaeroplasmataceae bacterium]|nr:hypothetical protein [Anaeroplasmataceae bacterium]
NISYKVYDEDNDILIDNLFGMFDGVDKDENEKDYDAMVEELSKSKLLNVVFRSSMVGNAVDQFLAVLLQNDEAPIPKNIDFVGDNGECAILLKSLKLLIKNDGKIVYEAFKASDDGVTGEAIISAFELFGKTIDSDSNEILLDELLKSQVFHYVLSNVFYYGGFGTLEFYIPSSSLYEVVEGSGENQKIYPVIKPEEIRSISRMMVICKDVIILLMDDDNDIDYAQIFTNQDFITHLEESVILKGTIANILINLSKENDVLILPQNLDNPEAWIKEKEVENMINAISALASVKCSNGEPLINQMMADKLKTEEFLNLENNVIDKLFDSVVLKYTVSNLLNSIQSGDFEIVIPARDLEINDAATIKGNYVDVVKKEVLCDILKDIKKIIKIDSDQDLISLEVQKIFSQKEFLVEDDVLHASIMNYLIKMSLNDSSIIVPDNYKTAFNEFKDDPNFKTNIWFGADNASIYDNEIYLMLDFIERCIADEEGNIPTDFSFENDISSQITFHNQEKDLNDLCSSALI